MSNDVVKKKKKRKKKPVKAAKRIPLKDRIHLPRLRKPEFSMSAKAVRRLIVAAVILLLLAGGFVYIAENYTVDTIIVEGSTHYTVEQITDMVVGDGFMSNNSLVLSLRYRNKEIKDVPFIETMSVRVVSPTSIRITVYEKAIAGYVDYMGQYIYFDKDGTVVESSTIKTEGIPQVIGMEFDHIVMYEKLPVADDNIFKQILDVAQLLDKYEISVDRIFFDRDYRLTLYFDDARVKLGSFDNIDEKIIRLKAILPELAGKKGVLRMENYTPGTNITTFEVDE